MSDALHRAWTLDPPYLYPAYRATVLRAPTKPLVPHAHTISELTGPVFGHDAVRPHDSDLTVNGRRNGEPLGQRIVVTGRITDERDRPVGNTLVELWQANAAGRYVHKVDQHDAPLDPNFLGGGRCMTDSDGRYRFYTIKPGSYPWGNHSNAWRPRHIHFSLFGTHIASRLVTQMYFPGDPLLKHDPIFQSVPEKSRQLLIADFDLDVTEEGFALGYSFDIVLRGPSETPFEGR